MYWYSPRKGFLRPSPAGPTFGGLYVHWCDERPGFWVVKARVFINPLTTSPILEWVSGPFETQPAAQAALLVIQAAT